MSSLYKSILGEEKNEDGSTIRKIPFGESSQLTCTFDQDEMLAGIELNTMELINEGKQFKWSIGKPVKMEPGLARQLKGLKRNFTICY